LLDDFDAVGVSRPMKIAVYTIALNETAHAERWAKSAVDADYRIVADTGSTDGTVKQLRKLGVTVHEIAIKPWRFDLARNAAMALIPSDVDVCCTMDMDRFLEPGWRDALESAWTPDTTALYNRVVYRNTVDDSKILREFPVKNFHSRSGYRFHRAVHEALVYSGQEVIRESADVVMTEVQDFSKDTRQRYTPLMEVAHRENPDDAQICFWLGRDYMYANRGDDAATLFERYIDLPASTWGEERSEAMRFLARVQPERKIHWLDRARLEAPHRREIWLDLAEQFHSDADWENLFWACSNGIRKTRRTNSYLDDGNAWGFRLHDLGAIAAWHLNVMDLAVEWGTEALSLDPSNGRLKNNLDFFEGLRQERKAAL
jgi:glycosyltransferase involved in cell wall biosynthesis